MCTGCVYLYDEIPDFMKPCNYCYSDNGESMHKSVEDWNEEDNGIKIEE